MVDCPVPLSLLVQHFFSNLLQPSASFTEGLHERFTRTPRSSCPIMSLFGLLYLFPWFFLFGNYIEDCCTLKISLVCFALLFFFSQDITSQNAIVTAVSRVFHAGFARSNIVVVGPRRREGFGVERVHNFSGRPVEAGHSVHSCAEDALRLRSAIHLRGQARCVNVVLRIHLTIHVHVYLHNTYVPHGEYNMTFDMHTFA